MKNKTFFLLLVIGGIFFLSAVNAAAQTPPPGAPAFDQSPAVVLDLWQSGNKGKYKDNVKFTNAAAVENVSFNIYGCEDKGKEWTLIGPAMLKNFSDTAEVSTSAKINKFRWFAVHSLKDIPFGAQAVTKNNDILIYIHDTKITGLDVKAAKNTAPAFEAQPSAVIDLKGKGKYEDNILLLNATKSPKLLFNVFGYDEKNGRWILIGTRNTAEANKGVVFNAWVGLLPANPDSINSPWTGEIDDFRYLAVYSVDNIPFNTQVTVGKNDVNITILQ